MIKHTNLRKNINFEKSENDNEFDIDDFLDDNYDEFYEDNIENDDYQESKYNFYHYNEKIKDFSINYDNYSSENKIPSLGFKRYREKEKEKDNNKEKEKYKKDDDDNDDIYF